MTNQYTIADIDKGLVFCVAGDLHNPERHAYVTNIKGHLASYLYKGTTSSMSVDNIVNQLNSRTWLIVTPAYTGWRAREGVREEQPSEINISYFKPKFLTI